LALIIKVYGGRAPLFIHILPSFRVDVSLGAWQVSPRFSLLVRARDHSALPDALAVATASGSCRSVCTCLVRPWQQWSKERKARGQQPAGLLHGIPLGLL
jgi:hypothetical protein